MQPAWRRIAKTVARSSDGWSADAVGLVLLVLALSRCRLKQHSPYSPRLTRHRFLTPSLPIQRPLFHAVLRRWQAAVHIRMCRLTRSTSLRLQWEWTAGALSDEAGWARLVSEPSAGGGEAAGVAAR